MSDAKKQEVTVQQAQTPAVQAPTQLQGIVPEDIVIPKILLMQGLSELVKDRKAQFGDIVRSSNGEKLADMKSRLDFIPLSLPESTFVIEVNKTGKFEYKKTIPRNSSNSGLPFNFTSDGDGNEVAPNSPNSFQAKRVKRMTFYALLPQDIKADRAERAKAEKGEFPDLSKMLMPVLISCRSTSFSAGKEVLTFFTMAASFKMPAWKAILSLGCYEEDKGKGSYYVMDVDRSKLKQVAEEDLPIVQHWADVVSRNANTLKVDGLDEAGAEADAPSSGARHF
jgi:hypothetical protein